MKILYAAGNRSASGLQFKRIKENLSEHEIKFAGFASSTQFVSDIDFLLDYFYSDFYDLVWNKIKSGKFNLEMEEFCCSILEFSPDLIIVDDEPLLISLGNFLKIPVWNCSPINLMDGCNHQIDDLSYRYIFHLQKIDHKLRSKPERNLIYSPFYFSNELKIKNGFEWIKPYSVKTNNKEEKNLNIALFSQREKKIFEIFKYSKYEGCFFSNSKLNTNKIAGFQINDTEYQTLLSQSKNVFCAAEASFLIDALISESNIFVFPNLKDLETLINASILQGLNFGIDLGQIELMEKYGVDEINRLLNRNFHLNKFKEKNISYLHDLINKG